MVGDQVIGMVSRASLLAAAEFARLAAPAHNDRELVVEMKTRLRQEPWVSNAGRLSVEASGGVISVTGFVETEEEREAIELMARGIPGCRGMENCTFPRTQLPARGF